MTSCPRASDPAPVDYHRLSWVERAENCAGSREWAPGEVSSRTGSALYHAKVTERDLDGGDGERQEPLPVLRLETRRLERRLPGLGLVRFHAPAASAEEALAPHAAAGDVRAFANTLIAVAIEEPQVTAADVDGWSERARAIARVASAEVIGCLAHYRRSAGSGMSGDERLLVAMGTRDGEIRHRLAMTAAAMRDNAVRLVDVSRALGPGVVETWMRQQRAIERMTQPSAVEQISRLSKQIDKLMRPGYFAQIKEANRQLASLRDVVSPRVLELSKQFAVQSRFASTFMRTDSPLMSVLHSYNDLSAGIASQVAGAVRPSYFGALHDVRRLTATSAHLAGIGRLAEQLRMARPHYFDQVGWLAEQFARPSWLDNLRRLIRGPVEGYLAWLEREWSELKARKTPAPIIFLLASLPAIVALPLMRALDADDELLLSKLEHELQGGQLVDELQRAVQSSATLDSVAKQHLVRGLGWVQQGQYVDAAPPLYQGLERAFRLTACDRGVIDDNNHFLVRASRRRMRTIDDVLPHLGLDHLYARFLRAWVFGDTGNSARHGDLDEDEHRRWVLRAVLAVLGWVEYTGAREDAVAELVERLELEPPAAEDEAAS
jgi:hypothetical protein